ncbi:MAG: polysaccharide lyase [Kiritimatiellae bacterium]|nr:polysaccharide lyase [Kiritimatiellia bacterium]
MSTNPLPVVALPRASKYSRGSPSRPGVLARPPAAQRPSCRAEKVRRAVILLPLLLFVVSAAQADLLLEETFEDRDWSPLVAHRLYHDHSGLFVGDPVRNGRLAFRFHLTAADFTRGLDEGLGPTVVRAELARWSVVNPGLGVPVTRWYGFSIHVESSWKNSLSMGTIITQWHHPFADPGEGQGSPHLSIQVAPDGTWLIENASNPVFSDPSDSHRTRRKWPGGPGETGPEGWPSIAKGQWVDWVIHAKWSYNADGLLRIWQNGTRVIDYAGPNCDNDGSATFNNPMFWKIGIYNALWKWRYENLDGRLPPPDDALMAAFDEVRIGDQNSGYAEVAPRGSGPAAPASPTGLAVE